MKKGFVFTVDALYALAQVLLLVELYIINAGAGPVNAGLDAQTALAKDKALTAFYQGAPLAGEVSAAQEYACYPVVRWVDGAPHAEKQCEARP